MDHAEIIMNAHNFTKNAFFNITQFPRWMLLFFYIVGPIIVGFIAATIVLQLIVLPILVNLLVDHNFGFTRDVLSNILQFFALLFGFSCIFFVPLMQGYCYRLFRSRDSMPDTGNILDLFINGWRINITIIIYAIPLIIISIIYMLVFLCFFPYVGMYSTTCFFDMKEMIYVGMVFSYAVVQFITTLIVLLFAFIGITHLCLTDSIREAVSLKTITDIISKISWYDYILSLVIMGILCLMVTFVVMSLLQLLSNNIVAMVVLYVFYIFALVPITVFFIKYLSEIYDTAFLPEVVDNDEFDFF
jgi:hypothetical protein